MGGVKESGFDRVEPRKPIPTGEWVIEVRLETEQRNFSPFTMRYTDSILAPCPENVAILIAKRMQQEGVKFAGLLPKKKKRAAKEAADHA